MDITAIQILEEKLKKSMIILLLKICKSVHSTTLFISRKQNMQTIKTLKYKTEFWINKYLVLTVIKVP